MRRVFIPKAGNPSKLRPLGVPTVEDRLLQSAVSRVLSVIYEADFLDGSFGFRPGRTAHQALAALRSEVMVGGTQYVYEADIRSFFDVLDHAWLMRMLELRIGDPWILRLIRKWLNAGILDHGQVTTPELGTPQGGLCEASHNPPYVQRNVMRSKRLKAATGGRLRRIHFA